MSVNLIDKIVNSKKNTISKKVVFKKKISLVCQKMYQKPDSKIFEIDLKGRIHKKGSKTISECINCDNNLENMQMLEIENKYLKSKELKYQKSINHFKNINIKIKNTLKSSRIENQELLKEIRILKEKVRYLSNELEIQKL